MQSTPLDPYKDFATELATLASKTVREQVENLSLEVKDDGSPVTSVDLEVERVLRERIDLYYPEHGVVGEEHGSRDLDADWVWVLDPIDGTRQFAAGLPNYGVLVALCHRGKPVVGAICQPLLQDLYLGVYERGSWLNGRVVQCRQTTDIAAAVISLSDLDAYDARTRGGMEAVRQASKWNVFDGGCLGFGALAAGALDVCVCGPNLDNFDICALVPVVEGAGGVITDWRGDALSLASEGEIVASCTASLHQQVLQLLALS